MYLPVSIANIWDDVLNLEREKRNLFSCIKSRYDSRLNVCLNKAYVRSLGELLIWEYQFW